MYDKLKYLLLAVLLSASCSGKDQKRALCIENGLLLSVI